MLNLEFAEGPKPFQITGYEHVEIHSGIAEVGPLEASKPRRITAFAAFGSSFGPIRGAERTYRVNEDPFRSAEKRAMGVRNSEEQVRAAELLPALDA